MRVLATLLLAATLAACQTTVEPRPISSADLVDTYGCGIGLAVGSADQRISLRVEPVDVERAFAGSLPGDDDLPGQAWDVWVDIGRDLFSNWCDDTFEEHEPEPTVLRRLAARSGRLKVVSAPSGVGPDACPQVVTVRLEHLVVGDDTLTYDLGDLELTNESWGCFAG